MVVGSQQSKGVSWGGSERERENQGRHRRIPDLNKNALIANEIWLLRASRISAGKRLVLQRASSIVYISVESVLHSFICSYCSGYECYGSKLSALLF